VTDERSVRVPREEERVNRGEEASLSSPDLTMELRHIPKNIEASAANGSDGQNNNDKKEERKKRIKIAKATRVAAMALLRRL